MVLPRQCDRNRSKVWCECAAWQHIEMELTREEERRIAGFGEIMLNEFGAKACEVQGAGPDQSAAIKADFADLLELLVAHLSDHNFFWASVHVLPTSLSWVRSRRIFYSTRSLETGSEIT